MELRPVTQTFTAGVRTQMELVGRYAFLLATVSPIKIEFGISGMAVANIPSIEAGLAVHLRPDQEEFTHIWITTTATEAVTLLVGDGEITYTPTQKPWFDRNPIAVMQSYNGPGLSPHGATTRWSYTVPAGKKAVVEAVLIEFIRTVPATAFDEMNAYILLTPSGGSAANYAILRMRSNDLGAEKNVHFGQGGILLAGDNMLGGTSDSSTGGSATYSLSLKATEFNA